MKFKQGGKRRGAGRKSSAPYPAPDGMAWCPRGKHFVLCTDEFFYFRPNGERYSYCRMCEKEYSRERKRIQYNRWADRKAKVVEAYGGVCELCGENDPYVLQLHHITRATAKIQRATMKSSSGNWLYQHVISQGFPDSYQLLCLNCHAKKHRKRPRVTEEEIKAVG